MVACRAWTPRLIITALALALALAIGFSGCSITHNPLPTAHELMYSGVVPAGATEDSLWRGRALAVTDCAACHRFLWPYEYPPDEWPAIIRRMGTEPQYTGKQLQDLTAYFVAASRTTGGHVESESSSSLADAVAAPESQDRGRLLAREHCVKCHRYYEPQEFAPDEWFRIVQSKAELTSLSAEELMDIARYYTADAARQTP